MKHLFLGGNRSGKSQLAEKAVVAWQQEHPAGQVIYVATANNQYHNNGIADKATDKTAGNSEMQQRIAIHQARRPKHWQLLEVPVALTALLARMDNHKGDGQPVCLLIDCLTLWLTNVMLQEEISAAHRQQHAAQAMATLSQAVAQFAGNVVIVSNEVGQGIVPMDAISRQFADLSGMLNQQMAAACDSVTLAVAGLSMPLK